MIAANPTDGAPQPLLDRAATIADLYHRHLPLTSAERRALPAYTGAAAAMELPGTLYARHIDGDDRDETTYLIELGTAVTRRPDPLQSHPRAATTPRDLDRRLPSPASNP
ncbi:hypothetical protein [Micromonospora sp. WMMD1082]|uniref:hypothetical protein n=1 Tax=Micromonospora sp. WMMD1082 TaxID=3016104 RepID=UPI002417AD3C|nr:hypothetical protein [Micromonospora sp. WMMD1082]MDG4795485.1 hypothetical protein [Micromonospora sp. WMMD1082]